MTTSAVAFRTEYSAFLETEYSSFLRVVSAARQRVLLLDYDGTLAGFTSRPSLAMPYPRVPRLLGSLMNECSTRVVMITGRAARDLQPLLGLNPPPEIWGSHGLERLTPNGAYEVAHIPEQGRNALDAAVANCIRAGMGKFLEQKPGSVALHWRGRRPELMEAIRAFGYRMLAPLACRANLILSEFDGGMELRARGCNKGHAVRAILAETDPEAPVAYLGDDLGDEDAFRALQGRGLTILVRPEYRPTEAQLWLRPPDELVQFLGDWISACGGAA